MELRRKKQDRYIERRKGNRMLTRLLLLGILIQLSIAGWVLAVHDDAVRRVQEQRYDTIFWNCEDQNERHLRAVERAEELLPNTAVVKLLIEEMLPYQEDCSAYTRTRVRGF